MENNKLIEAIELRQNNKPEQAMYILKELLQVNPDDPEVNYQMAWTCDLIGQESMAVPFYEKALQNGLNNDRSGAMLGLGSTYRCLGEYEKSSKIFDLAVKEFPENRALKVFRALTYYNLGKADESIGQLLNQLLDTTNDESIKSYERALRLYSKNLHQIWK